MTRRDWLGCTRYQFVTLFARAEAYEKVGKSALSKDYLEAAKIMLDTAEQIAKTLEGNNG